MVGGRGGKGGGRADGLRDTGEGRGRVERSLGEGMGEDWRLGVWDLDW